ncbi:methylated-DNA--[protein]-cysteine S-methyltransferase [Peptoanaerobacter stomatis]
MKKFYIYYFNDINRYVTIVDEDSYIISIEFDKINYDFNYEESEAISALKKELDKYFAGELKEFKTKYKLKNLTEFQMKVLKEVEKVKYGEYISYNDIANAIESPKSDRAVGNAVGRNPLPIIVPCHRIIRKDKKLGGYTGGTDIKIKLVEIEDMKF